MVESLFNLPRPIKRLIFLLADILLIPVSLYAAFALRYDTLVSLSSIEQSRALFLVMIGLGGLLIYVFKLPLIKLNTFETRAMLQVGLVAVSLSILTMAASYMLRLPGSRSIPLIFGAVFFLSSVSMRSVGLYLLTYQKGQANSRLTVAIYGAGSAGIQLASALRQCREARPIVFIDDNPNLSGLMVAGLPVFRPAKLETVIKKWNIQKVLVAMPSVPKERQNRIISDLSMLPIEVQILPSYVDLMAGDKLVKKLRPVTPNELLGRNQVDLDIPEIVKAYAGRVVMVTGAGGSIGSELCRQLLRCKPLRIVLFEQSEYHLYSIDRKFRPEALAAGIDVVAKLGSVTNKACVSSVIATEGIDVILHAAAYKHVPLVEENELEGARNNVFGTQVVSEAASSAGIERLILVSTDKAVRPTNIMGATKRMAELVVQDIQTRSNVTKFAIVRFGNVLGSSGSVLPLFQKQIEAGGPVTVTHPDVTRFFMTIPESARLVLLAGAYGNGGDVFVLDMGEPRKIIDIARQMITLSGREVLSPENSDGDIEIKITGLRPGEKLYEELLIDSDSLCLTPHPKILRAEEAMISQFEVASMLREIEVSLESGDTRRLRNLVATRVEGYHQQADTLVQG